MTTPTQHQGYQPFPRLETPIANPDGSVSIPWYRLFITMWQRSGGGSTPGSGAVNLVQNSLGAVQAFLASTGALLGTVLFTTGFSGGAAQPQVVGASPYQFKASSAAGTLVVSSGAIQLSRDDGITFYPCGLQGGAIPMLQNDIVRVTYYGGAPTVTFLPWA